MSARREILYLAHRIPFPPDKGDKIRTHRTLEHLARRFDVHLAAFVDDPDDFAHEAALQARFASVFLAPLSPRRARLRSAAGFVTGEPLSFPYYRDGRMRAHVEKLRARPLAAEFAFSSTMAAYLLAPRKDRPRIFDLCDADAEKWRQYAVETRGPMRFVYAREGRRLAVSETRMLNEADACFAVSREEAAVFARRAGAAKPCLYFGNGVDADYFAPDASRPLPADAGDIVFIGAMDYRANVDAALWFAREVWPRIRASMPAARFAIVGARPAPAIAALDGAEGIAVTGRVPDVRPYLQHAQVAIAPLRIARGVQNKVLEGMAAARAVVATSGALEGIDAKPGVEALVADAPDAFAAAVLALLRDPARARQIGEAGRARVAADYSWPAQLARLDAALEALGL